MAPPPKAPDAFRTIGEVADWLGVSAHVLRFWESRFPQIKPVKRAGGRRYYRPSDMALLGGIRQLLHEDGLTIKGVQKVLREQGVRAVAARSRPITVPAATDAGTQPDLFADVGPGSDHVAHPAPPPPDAAGTVPDRPSPVNATATIVAPGGQPSGAMPADAPPAPRPAVTGPREAADTPLHEALARLPRGRIPRLKLVTILGAARRLRDRLAAAE